MSNIDQDIEAYNRQLKNLEANSIGKWVLFHNKKLVDIFETFEDAAKIAVKKFGKGPFLIRQVGSPPVTLPVSIAYF